LQSEYATISRFEQNDKDIQLSSVLAILDVLGMTDKRTLYFQIRNRGTNSALA